MTTTQVASTSTKPENPLLNLAFNLVIPILILEKLGPKLGPEGPLTALLLALAFPLGYGLYDWAKRKKANWLSAFGMLSVLVTGGLALVKAQGIWFAVSEAALPGLLGIGVLASAFTSKPFVSSFILNDSVVNTAKIHEQLSLRGAEGAFRRLLKHSTLLFSASFFLSASLNFFLARRIFIPIDVALAEEIKTQTLNQQLAEMRYLSIFVIMIPMFIFGIIVMWHLFRGVFKTTGLKLEEVMKTQ